MHEHVVHRLLERVGIDALGHRQVALRVHVHAQHAVALLREGGSQVERRRCLGDAALLVGERDDLRRFAHGTLQRRGVTHTRPYSHALKGILHNVASVELGCGDDPASRQHNRARRPAAARPPPGVPARQGRCRPLHARSRNGPARTATRAAGDDRRGQRARRRATAVRPPGRGRRETRARSGPVDAGRRPAPGAGGIPARPAAAAPAGRRDRLEHDLRLRRRGDAGAARATDDRQDLGAGAGAAAHTGGADLRRRRGRRARDRSRAGAARGSAHLRAGGRRRPDRAPGAAHRVRCSPTPARPR